MLIEAVKGMEERHQPPTAASHGGPRARATRTMHSRRRGSLHWDWSRWWRLTNDFSSPTEPPYAGPYDGGVRSLRGYPSDYSMQIAQRSTSVSQNATLNVGLGLPVESNGDRRCAWSRCLRAPPLLHLGDVGVVVEPNGCCRGVQQIRTDLKALVGTSSSARSCRWAAVAYDQIRCTGALGVKVES